MKTSKYTSGVSSAILEPFNLFSTFSFSCFTDDVFRVSVDPGSFPEPVLCSRWGYSGLNQCVLEVSSCKEQGSARAAQPGAVDSVGWGGSCLWGVPRSHIQVSAEGPSLSTAGSKGSSEEEEGCTAAWPQLPVKYQKQPMCKKHGSVSLWSWVMCKQGTQMMFRVTLCSS